MKKISLRQMFFVVLCMSVLFVQGCFVEVAENHESVMKEVKKLTLTTANGGFDIGVKATAECMKSDPMQVEACIEARKKVYIAIVNASLKDVSIKK